MAATKPELIRLDDDSTKADYVEALGHMCHAAKREMPVVGTPLRPTPWDRRHQALNALLDDWQSAPG